MFRALLVFVALLTPSVNAYADCAGSRLHDRFRGAATVFVADVLDTMNRDVNFDIREAFKNARPGRATVTFGFLTSESYWFRPGERVLVYAFLHEGALTTTCSGTRRVTENDSDLTILRHLARGDAGGTVEGVLSRFDYNWLRYPGMKITLRPRSRSQPARTVVTGITTTGEQGRGGGFRFEWVLPGEYVVVLEAQRGIKRQERVITVAARQKLLEVPPFIISAKEHPLIADPDD